jgi:hypothetical protein
LRNSSLLTLAPTTSVRRICAPGSASATLDAIIRWASCRFAWFSKRTRTSWGEPNFLHSEVAEAERCEGFADLADLERLRRAQFDNDTAAEIHPEIEARIKEEHHR